jgi:hypothetical protein
VVRRAQLPQIRNIIRRRSRHGLHDRERHAAVLERSLRIAGGREEIANAAVAGSQLTPHGRRDCGVATGGRVGGDSLQVQAFHGERQRLSSVAR